MKPERVLTSLALLVISLLSHASHAMERWYPTPTGPEIKSTCFVDEPTTAQLRNLDASMAETAARMHACKQNYPELTPYIEQWLEDFRGVRIRCNESNRVGSRVRGMTVIDERFFPVLIQNPALQTQIDRNQKDRAIDTLIHESLHSIDANNTSALTHNHNETLPSDFMPNKAGETCFTHAQSCETRNVITDRVSMIAGICSGNVLHTSYSVRAEYALFQQMLHCGIEQGCAKTFAEGRQPRLSEPAAELLCKRVFEAGHCRRQTGTMLRPGMSFERIYLHEMATPPRCTQQWNGESVERILESYQNTCAQPDARTWNPEAYPL